MYWYILRTLIRLVESQTISNENKSALLSHERSSKKKTKFVIVAKCDKFAIQYSLKRPFDDCFYFL